jgi:hypothetical protein
VVQRVHVGAVGECDPHEVTALRIDELGLCQVAAQRVAQGLRALGERLLDRVDRALDRAGGTELIDDRLRDHVR